MAKEEYNNNFALIALVAIVAVVGLVGLVMMQGDTNKAPTYITEDRNMVGDVKTTVSEDVMIGGYLNEQGYFYRIVCSCASSVTKSCGVSGNVQDCSDCCGSI